MTKQTPYRVSLNAGIMITLMLVCFGVFFSLKSYLQANVAEFRFEREHLLWCFVLLPVFTMWSLFNQYVQNGRIQQMADDRLLMTLIDKPSNQRSLFKHVLLFLSLFSLIIALANPQYGYGKVQARSKGAELMIALDISNSMLAEDQANGMSRLRTAKLAINQLLPKLKGDRIGVVIFAGDAFTQVPITSDYRAVKSFLQPVEPNFISKQGTSIGAAIETCIKSFTPQFSGSKAIIVISDGEDHEEFALQAAQESASQQIVVHTIGIGDPNGSPIPFYENGVKTGLKRDANGNTVITRLNEQMLSEVAQTGNGVYIRTRQAQFGLETLLERIRNMNKAEFEATEFTAYDDQFIPFLIMSFIFLLMDVLAYPAYTGKTSNV